MKKNLIRVLVVSLFAIGLYFVASHLTQPNTEQGEKEITIIISVNTADEQKEVVKKTFRTDAEFLSEALDEAVEKGFFSLKVDGKKDDPYGRFIVGFNEYETKDMSAGPWWTFDSTTNESCVTAGFCSGIDLTPVYDQDVFEFIFKDTF